MIQAQNLTTNISALHSVTGWLIENIILVRMYRSQSRVGLKIRLFVSEIVMLANYCSLSDPY